MLGLVLTLTAGALAGCGSASVTTEPANRERKAIEDFVKQHLAEVLALNPDTDVYLRSTALVPGDTVAPAFAEEGAQWPVTVEERSWFVWIDRLPVALFGHPVRFLLIRDRDLEVRAFDANFWPVIDGQDYLPTYGERWSSPDRIVSGGAQVVIPLHEEPPAEAMPADPATLVVLVNGFIPAAGASLQGATHRVFEAWHGALGGAHVDASDASELEDGLEAACAAHPLAKRLRLVLAGHGGAGFMTAGHDRVPFEDIRAHVDAHCPGMDLEAVVATGGSSSAVAPLRPPADGSGRSAAIWVESGEGEDGLYACHLVRALLGETDFHGSDDLPDRVKDAVRQRLHDEGRDEGHYRLPTCRLHTFGSTCHSDSECDDGDPTTLDRCDDAGVCHSACTATACMEWGKTACGSSCEMAACAGGGCQCVARTPAPAGCSEPVTECGPCRAWSAAKGACVTLAGCAEPRACGACQTWSGATGTCVSAADDTACEDGDACTAGDRCSAGTCVPGSAATCDDGDPCTADACSPETGCTHSAGEACCTAHADCDDQNACTKDWCVDGACEHPAAAGACDDGDPCTVGDTCQAGTCAAGAVQAGCCTETSTAGCDDGNPCTGESCKAGACFWFDLADGFACDTDGDACTTEACQTGGCVQIAAVTCPPADAPCTTLVCQPTTGECAPEVCPDADGNPCTGAQCVDDACVPVPVPDGPNAACDDGDPCTTLDGCLDGACASQPVNCDDGLPCTVDACVPGIGCTSTASDVACDDQDVCTQDLCLPGVGCKHLPNTAPCDDGDPCTAGDTCKSGACLAGTAAPCDDGVDCTVDTCAPDGACTHTPSAALCPSDGPCTAPVCEPATGCAQTAVAGDCDDGDACTLSETCQGGSCVPTAWLGCDDDDACTEDDCQPETGCAHTPYAPDCVPLHRAETPPWPWLNECFADVPVAQEIDLQAFVAGGIGPVGFSLMTDDGGLAPPGTNLTSGKLTLPATVPVPGIYGFTILANNVAGHVRLGFTARYALPAGPGKVPYWTLGGAPITVAPTLAVGGTLVTQVGIAGGAWECNAQGCSTCFGVLLQIHGLGSALFDITSDCADVGGCPSPGTCLGAYADAQCVVDDGTCAAGCEPWQICHKGGCYATNLFIGEVAYSNTQPSPATAATDAEIPLRIVGPWGVPGQAAHLDGECFWLNATVGLSTSPGQCIPSDPNVKMNTAFSFGP